VVVKVILKSIQAFGFSPTRIWLRTLAEVERNCLGKIRLAEVHWFEAHGIGKNSCVSNIILIKYIYEYAE
jgi:hypothetical protein